MKTVRLILGMAFVLLLVLFSAAPLRAQDQFEVFGGYSYFRASETATGQTCPPTLPPCSTVTVTSHPNLNGWEGSFEYKAAKEIGIEADFGGYYGSLSANAGGASTHTNTYLFGPRVSFPGRFSPFVHVLAGAAHQSTSSGSANFGITFFPAHSTTAFALALGGGLDIDVAPLVRLRLVQFDYVGANSGLNFHNQARISTGVVIHF